MKVAVMVKVNGKAYLTSIEEKSAVSAEYYFLNMSENHGGISSVEGCLAFEEKQMMTDTFVGCVMTSNMVSVEELENVIYSRNIELEMMTQAKDELEQIKKQMSELKSREAELLEKLMMIGAA